MTGVRVPWMVVCGAIGDALEDWNAAHPRERRPVVLRFSLRKMLGKAVVAALRAEGPVCVVCGADRAEAAS